MSCAIGPDPNPLGGLGCRLLSSSNDLIYCCPIVDAGKDAAADDASDTGPDESADADLDADLDGGDD